MSKLPPGRRLLKFFHPEGIPWPGSALYNLISTSGIFQRNYELVAGDILNYCSKGRLLDIGTGPGWLLLKLLQRCPTMNLVGIDSSAAMVAKARQNIADSGLAEAIEIKQGNADKIPFSDSTFDIVVSTWSIHHWKQPTQALNEIHRVLKADSFALIYDLTSDTPRQILANMAHQYGRFITMMLWLHSFEEPFYSRRDFKALAEPSLFRDCNTRFVGVSYCLILKR
jgi:ubiquinone/menaquinone biosynthesis C-methylase UbiE